LISDCKAKQEEKQKKLDQPREQRSREGACETEVNQPDQPEENQTGKKVKTKAKRKPRAQPKALPPGLEPIVEVEVHLLRVCAFLEKTQVMEPGLSLKSRLLANSVKMGKVKVSLSFPFFPFFLLLIFGNIHLKGLHPQWGGPIF